MLISKYVEIGISSGNYEHFRKKGYEIPVHYNVSKHKYQFIRGSRIMVKVEDLMISRVNVTVQCDNCEMIKDVIYQGYLNCLHDDGKYYCLQCASRLFNGGVNSYRWNPNLTDKQREANKSRVNSVEGYEEFSRIVKQRDGFKCILCGSKKDLQVHHLNSFSSDEANQINPLNGVTLCKDCHEGFHRIYGKKDNTREQFDEYSNHKALDLTCTYELSSLKKVIHLNTGKIYDTVKKCADDLGIDIRRIYDVCHHVKHSVNNEHFMYYDEYLNTPKDELKNAFTYQGYNEYGRGNKKSVVCVNTGEVFECISDAYRKHLGMEKNDGRIAMCCNGLRKYVGKLPNGEVLEWKWNE